MFAINERKTAQVINLKLRNLSRNDTHQRKLRSNAFL